MPDDATQAMPPEGDHRRKPRTIVGSVLALVLLVAALASCGGGDSDVKAEGSTSSSSTSSTSSTSTSTQGTTVTTTANTTTPTQPPATGPQITSLKATPNFVVCQPGGAASTTVSWSTANASQTTLSIDGPGVFGTYGPSGSVTSGPGCPPSEQSQTHTYLVTAKGLGGQTQKSISVKFMAQPGA